MQYRVYIKPFDVEGNYLADYIEVSDDVITISDIQQKVDSSDYDVGVYKNSGVNIALRNDHGKYSETTTLRSIFATKRKNSMVKITWAQSDYPLIAGFFDAGEEVLGTEITIFEGLLNEISSTTDIAKQTISFAVLGYESILNETLVPFSLLNNGDTLADAIFLCLLQAPFNTYVTVSYGNINPGLNTTIDDKTDLENKTAGEALKELLLISNSVLYIKDNEVYVSSREDTVETGFIFYGQGSTLGIESIISIPTFRDGLNRTFNYWVWPDTTLVAQDVTSVLTYGILKKDVSSSIITVDAKRTAILESNRDEFRNPKIELELVTPLTYGAFALNILDKVAIDYPTSYTPADNNPLPTYGNVVYGESRYPFGQFVLTVESSRRFKILGKKLNKSKNSLTFTLREV